jgi:hypothetical protein
LSARLFTSEGAGEERRASLGKRCPRWVIDKQQEVRIVTLYRDAFSGEVLTKRDLLARYRRESIAPRWFPADCDAIFETWAENMVGSGFVVELDEETLKET